MPPADLYRIFDRPSRLGASDRARLRELWLREGSLTRTELAEMRRLEARISNGHLADREAADGR